MSKENIFIENSMNIIKTKIEESAKVGEKPIVILSGIINFELLSRIKTYVFLNYPRSVKKDLSFDDIQIAVIPKNNDMIICINDKNSELATTNNLEETMVTILSVKGYNAEKVANSQIKLEMIESGEDDYDHSPLKGTVISVNYKDYAETLYSFAETINHA